MTALAASRALKPRSKHSVETPDRKQRHKCKYKSLGDSRMNFDFT